MYSNIVVRIPMECASAAEKGLINDIMDRYRSSNVPSINDRTGQATEEKGASGDGSGTNMDIDVDGDASADESEGEEGRGADSPPKKRRRGMPQREDFTNVLEYLEAKYAAGINYDSDTGSDEGAGSVYSEDGGLVDDGELRAQLEDDVIGGLEVEEGEGEGFFITTDNVNLVGEQELEAAIEDEKAGNKTNAKKGGTRKPRTKDNTTDEEYLREYEEANREWDKEKRECKGYAFKFENERRRAATIYKKVKLKVPSNLNASRVLKIRVSHEGVEHVVKVKIGEGKEGTSQQKEVPIQAEGEQLKVDGEGNEKINIPNTDEGGERIERVLNAYAKVVSSTAAYSGKVLKKREGKDFKPYDAKEMRGRKFSWFGEWARGEEKEWEAIKRRWKARMRQRSKRKEEEEQKGGEGGEV